MRTTALTLTIALACPIYAHAADSTYPNRPIRFVVPQPPGGGTDVTARLLAPPLQQALGVQIVVDNHSGAGGIVGTDLVAKAAPDGYTWLLGYTGPLTINPNLYPKLPYHALEDFDPISMAVASPFLLVVIPQIKVNTVAELVAYAKANPGKVNFGSPGNGSLHHLAMEWFNAASGIKMTHVPFRGGGQVINSMRGGEIQTTLGSSVTWLPQVRAGRFKAVAVTSRERSRVAPDIPTNAESGVPGYDARNWFGVVVPHGTPKAIVTRISALIAATMKSPDITAKVLSEGADPVGNTPEEFAALIRSESKRWGESVKLSNAKVD